MKKFLFLLLVPFALNAQPFSLTEINAWKKRAEKITIIRDNWGIAHVYGKTDADAVFGMLYAQCEDDFNRVELNYITALGRLAEVEGEQALYADLRSRLYNDTVRAIRLYKESPSDLRKLMDAFADGINFYLSGHPDIKPQLLTRFQSWYPLLFSEGSIGGDLTGISLSDLKQFYGNERSPSTTIDDDAEPRGSNGFAIAPSRSESGNALLLINPHTSFYFRSEIHVNSDEGLNAYGAVTWGQFFIYQGFNPYCGWMHTSTYADAVDEYLETVSRKGKAVFYKHGSTTKPFKQRDITLKYKTATGKGEKTITAYFSHHGPVIGEKKGKWLTISMMDDPLHALQQSYGRTKARGYDEYKKVMELNGNSSNNTVFADNKGTIAYWHGNFIPKRDTRFNWNAPVDGSDPDTDWKGLHSIGEIIQLRNPANGWLQNCNSTPFTAAGADSPKRTSYPSYMAPDGQNYRGINAQRVLSRAGKFTLESLIKAAYDPALTAFEKLIPALEIAWDKSNDDTLKQKLASPFERIMRWDKNATTSSTGATLAMYWGRKLQLLALSRLASDEQAAHRSDVVFMIDYMIANTSEQEKLKCLDDAVSQLTADFQSWEIPWGEVNRFQRLTGKVEERYDDAEPSLPVAFASSFWGSLPAFGSRQYPNTKKMYGNVGNSFVAVVEFGQKIRAKSIVTGGASSDPSSPNFNDQSPMYVKAEFKDVLYYREDVEKNAVRKYQPGK
jgi:acyl-homoserine lactone acylase PvdQ